MKSQCCKKLLSGFLSFLFVFYTAAFSFSAFVQTVQADLSDDLLFPLEKITTTSSDGTGGTVLNNPICKLGEVLGLDNSCRKEEFADMNNTKEGCEEAKGTWDEVNKKCNDIPWPEQQNILGAGNNRDMVAGVAGGVASFAASQISSNALSQSGAFLANGSTLAGVFPEHASSISGSLTTSIGSSLMTDTAASTYSSGLQAVGLGSETATNMANGLPDAIGGAAVAGVVAALVTLIMTGDIKAAAIAGVKSAVTAFVAQQLAIMIFGAVPGIGWVIAIGVILSMLMSMFCPVVMIELPDGSISFPSSFLVGKINKKMKGDSWEKILLTEEEMGTLSSNCASVIPQDTENFFLSPRLDPRGETSHSCVSNDQKFPFKMDSSKAEIIADNAEVDREKFAPLGVIIAEVLPEILYLDSLKVFDLEYKKAHLGKWFMDQNGNPQYFSAEKSQHWQKEEPSLAPMLFGKMAASIPDATLPGESTENVSINQSSSEAFALHFTKPDADTLEFEVQKPKNSELKLLFEGGIQEAYHAEKLRTLAHFRPVLTWFYALTDNTFLGKIVEREIFAKEGFTLQEKIGNDWKTIHQWVSYDDQRRALSINTQSTSTSYRIFYDSKYLKLEDVYGSIEKNPDYSIKELHSENLLPSLQEIDGNIERIETGTYYKFTFGVPYIDTATTERELFMQTNGYYHPLTDKEYLKEMRENYTKIQDWIMRWVPES